ncbi:phosphotransferase family protein [Carbonactinospora thermoautotrophica]|uniref:phosphotransferase family protein n=1 Tax=Carbonactinospora thermoautotrophica TaxID=1469144 RepID=UPI00226E856F|nr:aminoglycoside phosphotransferase family protein [Carbonactinospora thermoautotrophica]
MSPGVLHKEMHQILVAVCRRVGLDPSGAELLRLRSNAVFRLREGVVVRVATAPDALPRVVQALEVTRWLAGRGFPTVRPADVPGQPLLQDGRAVSFWRYVPAGPGGKPTTRDLGRLLRALHDQPAPAFELRRLADPLARVRYAVEHAPGVLSDRERAWLADRIAELTEAWDNLRFSSPPALLHGDGWIDNLLRDPGGRVVLCDWDSVSVGPREWDLIPTYHGHRRFGLSAADVEAFADAYGWDLRDWSGYDTLVQIRELYAIGIHIRNAPADPFSRRELAVRLDSIMRDDPQVRWHLAEA